MSEQQPQLVISKDSWHYRHYQRIRRLYGYPESGDKATSLCPYVQTMIWGSLFFIVSLPFQVIGWLFMKTCRLLYKGMVQVKAFQLVNWIDSKRIGDMLANSAEQLKIAPVVAANIWGLACLMLAMSVLAIVAGIGVGVWQLILAIPFIPHWLWMGAQHLGWAVVWVGWAFAQVAIWLAWCLWMVLYWLGFAVVASAVWCFDCMLWLVAAGWLWLAIGQWTALILVGCALSVGATWLVLAAFNTKLGKGLLRWLSMKLNGYKEARELAEEHRRQSEVDEEPQEPVEKKPCWCRRAIAAVRVGLSRASEWLWDNVAGRIYDFFASKKGSIEGKRVKVLSAFAAIGTFFWAAKHQMCPIVTFVEQSEVDEDHKEDKEGDSPSDPAEPDAAAERPEAVNAKEDTKE